MSPVHFFSHGSTMMLGEDSASARYWEKMGDEAIENGVEHVVIMVSVFAKSDIRSWGGGGFLLTQGAYRLFPSEPPQQKFPFSLASPFQDTLPLAA